ncbi:MAG: glutamine--fructose-6-phosphate transaminase (isomerizing) [Clostridia bacterium]|nr:glutamine--fructose-6-phosphate transaminase (isomerizing) [Clostridia bacterium]
MCGIIGYTGNNKAVPYLLEGLGRLEYRGYDSTGIATTQGNSINITKAKGRLSVLKSIIASKKQSTSTVGIGHTRWATHGEPSTVNSHPHLSRNGLFAVVHNGIIENYKELKSDLQKDGYVFRSDTDTEVIAHLLERNYDGDLVSTVSKTAKMLTGAYALCILCRDFPEKIVCTRLGSPLVVCTGDEGTFVSSDTLAISGHADKVFRPKAGEIILLAKDKVSFFNKALKEIFITPEKLTLKSTDTDKEGYEHYMLKEIMEQPEAVRSTLSHIIKNGRISFDSFSLTKQEAEAIRGIYIVACGSAYHVGVSGKYIIEKLTGIPTHTDIASEFRYRNPPVSKNDLCIIISQSGETADSIAAMKKVKEKGAKVLSLVNVEGSTISLSGDYVIHTKAGPEIAVATTKAYSCQLAVIYCLGVYFSSLLGILSEKEQSRLIEEILSLPETIEATIVATRSKAESLSELFTEKEHAYFIGRGTDYAAAMEGSLKLKEISYIHSEAYGAGELKHGTISLIEPGTMVVALMSDENVFTKTYSNVREVKARSARVLAVSTKKHEHEISSLDHCIIIPDCSSLTVPSAEIIPLQLLSYFTALKRSCDIDKPRNLAKSVTVE